VAPEAFNLQIFLHLVPGTEKGSSEVEIKKDRKCQLSTLIGLSERFAY